MNEAKSLEPVKPATGTLSVFADENPIVGMERANRIALKLRDIVMQRKLAVKIGNSFHLTIEAWNACGAMVGVVAKTEWTKTERDAGGRFDGVIARAQVVSIEDQTVISAAENACYVDEQVKKRNGDYYHRWVENCPTHGEPTLEPCGLPNRHAILSMAQTRAASKALAQVLRWIPVMAGYAGTPAEEMTEGSAAADETQSTPNIDAEQVKMLRKQIKEAADRVDGVSAKEVEKNICSHFGVDALTSLPEIKLGDVVKAVVTWDGPLDAS